MVWECLRPEGFGEALQDSGHVIFSPISLPPLSAEVHNLISPQGNLPG